MKRKPIKIDWEALEEAFTNTDDTLVYYLDLLTGHVVLEGEGEDEAFHDPDEPFEPNVSGPADTRGDATRLYVEPPTVERKLAWMVAFLDGEGGALSPEVAGELREALGVEDAAGELSRILNANPDERDAWYVYRADRVRERIVEWLGEHEVRTVDRAPWSD